MLEAPNLNSKPEDFYDEEGIKNRIDEILKGGIQKKINLLYPILAMANPNLDSEKLGFLVTLKVAEEVYIPGLTSVREKFFGHPKWKETTALIREEVNDLEPHREEIVRKYQENKKIWKKRKAENQ